MSSRSKSKEKHSKKHHHHHHHQKKNRSRSKSFDKEKNKLAEKEKNPRESRKGNRELKAFEKETWKNDKVDLEKLTEEQCEQELKKNVKELQKTEEQLKKLRTEDNKKFMPTKKKSPPKFEKLTTADPKMIEVIVNDRLGKKQRIKCCPSDTIGDFKKLIAVQTGTRAEKIKLQKSYCVYKDQITLEDYEIQDGMGLEMYYN